MVPRAEDHLGVGDTRPCEVFTQLDGEATEVVDRGEQLAELEVVVDEVEPAAERPSIGAHPVGKRRAVAFGELPQGLGPGAPLQVQVQLHRWQGAQVSHPSMVVGSVTSDAADPPTGASG